jgi:hypothetical protein
MALPKLFSKFAQAKIVIDHEEPLDEDEDYFKKKKPQDAMNCSYWKTIP